MTVDVKTIAMRVQEVMEVIELIDHRVVMELGRKEIDLTHLIEDLVVIEKEVEEVEIEVETEVVEEEVIEEMETVGV
jgi:hypothetical protein